MDINSKIERFKILLSTLSETVIDQHLSEMESLSVTAKQDDAIPECPHCHDAANVIHWCKGRSKINPKPRFKCKACKKTFVRTTNTVMYHSRQSADVWATVFDDTIDGLSIDKTAEKLDLSHVTVFHMRHKILTGLQNEVKSDNVQLANVSEFDETYVLESYKGSPIPPEAHRIARKHGAVATKRGLSNEQVCICTAVGRDEGVVVNTVNRAKPSNDELQKVFEGHISDGLLVLTDGLKGYKSLESVASCTVVGLLEENHDKFFHLNTVNNLHSFIKDRYNNYRGVATKYLNRYNSLFASAYRIGNEAMQLCERVLFDSDETRYIKVKDIKERNILIV